MEKETDVLDKVLQVLFDALDGKVVNPAALDVAIRMTQFFWSTVYAERERERQITESLRHKWEDSIDKKDDK
ncbi:MAG: hypothetical protein ABWZ66_09555 [Pyrinomonadaceae bacterium]